MNKKQITPKQQKPPTNITNKKVPNNFKTLYHLSMRRKNKIIDEVKCSEIHINNVGDKNKTQRSKCVEDSLDNYDVCNQEEVEEGRGQGLMEEGDGKGRGFKKWSHSRSQSCPFINPSLPSKQQIKHEKQPYFYNKFMIQNESKRTLKKSSTLHRKNNRINHKYSIGNISQVSQQSNTVIVHSLPIQHLSSMLYSLNHQKSSNKHNILKSPTSQISSSSSLRPPYQLFSIHTQLYFQTRLQQQMKVYDLNQELKKLNKQTQNVKIKQNILEKLATLFGRCQGYNDEENSLLIH